MSKGKKKICTEREKAKNKRKELLKMVECELEEEAMNFISDKVDFGCFFFICWLLSSPFIESVNN